jgi:hypothetical protein
MLDKIEEKEAGRENLPSPSGERSTNPPTRAFMQFRILGLSAGKRCVTKVFG